LCGIQGVVVVSQKAVRPAIDPALIRAEKKGEAFLAPLLAEAYDLVIPVQRCSSSPCSSTCQYPAGRKKVSTRRDFFWERLNVVIGGVKLLLIELGHSKSLHAAFFATTVDRVRLRSFNVVVHVLKCSSSVQVFKFSRHYSTNPPQVNHKSATRFDTGAKAVAKQ